MGDLHAGRAHFEHGRLLTTKGAKRALEEARVDGREILERHLSGDWGDLGEVDKKLNDLSVEHGERLLSAYNLPTGTRIWIITEADRSATTFLLPEEY